MTSEGLVVERVDASLVVVLDRPQARNALTWHMLGGLGDAVVEAESDPAIRTLVLTGTGDHAFCAGMDLRSLSEPPPADAGDTAGFQRLLRGEVAVPVIGAANGYALGGGLELLLGCDLIVAAEGARFGLPEVKRGLIPGGGGTFVSTRIPLSIALEMVLTGERIDAEQAERFGLVNVVVPADDVLPTALAYAGRIAANGPLAVAACKELTRLAVTDGVAAWERLQRLQPEIFGSEDALEGAKAFLEKRDPVWKGR